MNADDLTDIMFHYYFGDIVAQVWTHIVRKARDADIKSGDSGPQLDLRVCGACIWQPHVEALFDIELIDTDSMDAHASYS